MEAATTEATEAQAPAEQQGPPPRLRERYEQEVLPALVKRFSYSSPMQAPRLKKVTLNMGIGDAINNKAVIDAASEQLATIAGQLPNVRRARKSIASFKVREGMPVGVSVTLRGVRMWEFLDRFIAIAVPRIRDFRGFSARSFDGRGNYSVGVREQIIFPEVDYDSIDQVRGLDVTITTSAASDEEGFELLLGLGFPFSAEGRPGQADLEAEAEEARRAEEARERAEAEAAALEQLKEENPEAYAKPEKPEEEGEEGEGAPGESEGSEQPAAEESNAETGDES
jgi:large subunit ribosomal protein L5